MDRKEVITRVRNGLRLRTQRAWSVTGGTGTAWGWIRITAPPKRRVNGVVADVDKAALVSIFATGGTGYLSVDSPDWEKCVELVETDIAYDDFLAGQLREWERTGDAGDLFELYEHPEYVSGEWLREYEQRRPSLLQGLK